MSRHCYLLQTHREPAQIWRLAARLRADSPDAHIVLAHDASHCALDANLYREALNATVIAALTPVVRGEFSMVDAYFHAVRRMAEQRIEFDWLTLLSGQDYPLHTLSEYERFIDSQAFDAYLHYGDIFGPDNPWAPRRSQGKLRYYYHYRRLSDGAMPLVRALRRLNGVQKLIHAHTTLGPYLGVRAFSHPFRKGYRCYGGSAWHTLSHACVQYLLQARAEQHDVVEHFRRTMSPEEAFMQTVLVNSGRFNIHRGNLRYIDFTGSVGGSPRTLTISDLAMLEASGSYFARKFDISVDASVLDALDAHARVTHAPANVAATQITTESST